MSRIIRPLFACVSAIALVACSTSTQSAPSQQGNTQETRAPQTSNSIRSMADELAAKGDYDAALPLYRHLAATTADPANMIALAQALAARGVHTEAASVLTMVKDRGELTGEGFYLLGKSNLAIGKYQEALAAFDGALVSMPGNDKAISGRGVAQAALGQTEEAIATLSTSPGATTLSNLALVFAASNHPDVAIDILEPLVTAGRTGVQGRQNLALAYLFAGREKDAFRMARLDLDPASVNETFTFYRSLPSLDPAHRMQALVSGVVDPAWNALETGNLTVTDTADRRAAAARLASKPEPEPVVVAKVEKPKPEPKPAEEDRSNYVLTEVPPLLEPEGWALQIAAYRTTAELMRGWTILYRQSGDLLKDTPPRRSEVDFGTRSKKPTGFFYRLNAGPLKTLQEARTLCTALKERGTDCWIRPPEKSEGKLPDTPETAKSGDTATANTQPEAQ